MAHRIGRQGRRLDRTPFLVGHGQGFVLFRLATGRARAALSLRGMIGRWRAWRRRGWFDIRLRRASLQPCVLITQLLNLNPQCHILGGERLNDVQQLDHDLARGQIGNAVGVEVRYLHMRVVYQTFATLSLTA